MSKTASFERNNKKVINGWAFFDWANSSYALTISVAIFPGYYEEVTKGHMINILGLEMSPTIFYAYALSVAYLIIAGFSPLLSGIADFGGRKKFFLKFFTSLGSLACVLLYFFDGMDTLAIGTICFMLATIGFSGGLVFYNSYLPDIVTEDRYDKVSAKGYSYGYVGSVILLILNLIVILKPEMFGIAEDSIAVRIAFVMVGVWWFSFALIPFNRLPKDSEEKPHPEILSKGWEELLKIWAIVKKEANMKSFLFSFFFYSAGVQTLLFLASIFAKVELDFETTELIILILILQVVAIAGAHLFAFVSEKVGNKMSLMIMLVIWAIICLVAYFVDQSWQFYMLGGGVGLVMGGIQSLSRSTYSKLLPEKTKDTASFFSFYDILEKSAIVVGTFAFGFIEMLTGGMRNSVLALAVFFIIGMIILSFVKVKPASSSAISS